MNFLLIEKEDFLPGAAANTVRVTGRRHERLARFLKLHEGDHCKAGMLGGKLGSAVVLAMARDFCDLAVTFDREPPPPAPVVLAMALPRPQTFEKALRCGTEMGIKTFWFFHTFKVEKSYWQSPSLSPERMTAELKLGLEQCGDTILPQVRFAPRFKPFAEEILPGLPHPAYAGHPAAEALLPRTLTAPVTLILGPEGGFTDYEIGFLTEHAVTPVTLGSRILRTEHALPALLGRML